MTERARPSQLEGNATFRMLLTMATSLDGFTPGPPEDAQNLGGIEACLANPRLHPGTAG